MKVEFKITQLLRGDPDDLNPLIAAPRANLLLLLGGIILLGFVSYGFSVGLWRSPWMALFVAVKMPLLIFATLACNGLLNGMLALLLGSGLSFRQSLIAQLMSFSIAGLVLGTLAPVTVFMAINAPSPGEPGADEAHASFLLTHTLLVALAGLLSNLHLARLLITITPNLRTAGSTLVAWLAGNAFVGAQLSWILRPFFGTPSITVEFLRDSPFSGTFYETVWFTLKRLSNGHELIISLAILVGLIALHQPIFRLFSQINRQNNDPTSSRPDADAS